MQIPPVLTGRRMERGEAGRRDLVRKEAGAEVRLAEQRSPCAETAGMSTELTGHSDGR